MKQIFIAASIALTLGSCGNSGDENTNELNSINADSSIHSGSADTIENTGKGGDAQPSVKPDTLSNSGSNEQKNETLKDSSKTKQ